MEQLRKDFYIQNIADKKDIQEPSSPGPVDTGGTDIPKLCSDNDHLDAEVEEDYHDHLKNIFLVEGKKKVAHQLLAM